jgi:putative NADPH-quinone reductase
MKKSNKIIVIQGHPLEDSFCSALTNAYMDGAKESGAELRTWHLESLTFDPILHDAYRSIQELEPDLVSIQKDILWSDHIVLAFPIWWGMPPAKLKGFLDRTFVPGFAFKFATPESVFQEKKLSGRSARIISTMDSPPWYYRHLIGAPSQKMIKNSVLKFCGVNPIRFSTFGSVKLSSPKIREKWLKQAKSIGLSCR